MTNTPTNLDELRAERKRYTDHEWELYVNSRPHAIRVILTALPSLISELDEARKEIERLRTVIRTLDQTERRLAGFIDDATTEAR